MAKKAAKSAKSPSKKAPSAAQLAARKRFAAMAKARATGKKVVAKRVVSVNSKPKKDAKGNLAAKIPALGVKPLSKPAYAAQDFQTRQKREPIVRDRNVKNFLGLWSVAWM